MVAPAVVLDSAPPAELFVPAPVLVASAPAPLPPEPVPPELPPEPVSTSDVPVDAPAVLELTEAPLVVGPGVPVVGLAVPVVAAGPVLMPPALSVPVVVLPSPSESLPESLQPVIATAKVNQVLHEV